MNVRACDPPPAAGARRERAGARDTGPRPRRAPGRRRVLSAGLLAAAPLWVQTGAAAPGGEPPLRALLAPRAAEGSTPGPTADHASVRLAGWFHVVWNGDGHYLVIDDRGRSHRLIVDPELLRRQGGPRALARTRVTVVGRLISADPSIIEVTSVERE